MNLRSEMKVRNDGGFFLYREIVSRLEHDRVRLSPHRRSVVLDPEPVVDARSGGLLCRDVPVLCRLRLGRRLRGIRDRNILLRFSVFGQLHFILRRGGNNWVLRRDFGVGIGLGRPDLNREPLFLLDIRRGIIPGKTDKRSGKRKQYRNGACRDAHCDQEPTMRRPDWYADLDQFVPLEPSIACDPYEL